MKTFAILIFTTFLTSSLWSQQPRADLPLDQYSDPIVQMHITTLDLPTEEPDSVVVVWWVLFSIWCAAGLICNVVFWVNQMEEDGCLPWEIIKERRSPYGKTIEEHQGHQMAKLTTNMTLGGPVVWGGYLIAAIIVGLVISTKNFNRWVYNTFFRVEPVSDDES